MELCDLSALELKKLLIQKQISALEIVNASLQRVTDVDGRPGMLEPGEINDEDRKTVHAFISLTAERAREQAAAIDKKIADGQNPGLLAGIPFSTKDIFCVKDTYSTAASKILANFKAPYTATPVERMEAQGGIMLGKVNLDEFTYGSSNESLCLPTQHTKSMGHLPGTRWFFRWQCGICCSRGSHPFFRNRYGRLNSPAGSFLRCGRSQTHLWPGIPLWIDSLCVLPGLPWTCRPRYQ